MSHQERTALVEQLKAEAAPLLHVLEVELAHWNDDEQMAVGDLINKLLAALQGDPPALPAQPPFIIHAPELDGSAECFHGQDSGPNCANDAHYRLPTYNDWMGHSPAAKQWIARQAPPPASPDGPACAFCHRQPPPPHIVADDLSVAICFECIEKFSFKRTRQAPPPAVSGAEPEK
jgi:hypothetical protein